ncbi:MAG: DUF3822 family protein [Muribaculaceae bacterium]|nr:DUF3822 family protein [Muribaculaceae bacterium]
MSNPTPTVSDVSIQHPERWALDVAVSRRRVQFMLYAPEQDGSLVSREIRVDPALPALQAIENAVYDNPVLLDDYGRVRVVVRTPHFVVVPPEVAADAEVAASVLAAAFPGDDSDAATCLLPQCGVGIVCGLPRGMMAFLQRTFNTPPVVHHLYPLCEHFMRLNTGTTIARMFVNLHDDAMDMAVYRHGQLVLANSLPLRNAGDAAYLVLHTWQSLRLDALTDEIQLTGDKALRDALAPQLRQYVKYVMPAIFPAAAMRLGPDAMRAPLDLILFAICES